MSTNLELSRGMTFRDLRDHLNLFGESSLDLPVYVCNSADDNMPVESLTLFDSGAPHAPDNPLGFNPII